MFFYWLLIDVIIMIYYSIFYQISSFQFFLASDVILINELMVGYRFIYLHLALNIYNYNRKFIFWYKYMFWHNMCDIYINRLSIFNLFIKF